MLEHGAGELLDLGRQWRVAVPRRGCLAVVGEPVEHGELGLAGVLAGPLPGAAAARNAV